MLGTLSEGDIRLLKVFAKVVEAGGFSAAQIALNVSQSTISTHMTTLEHRLGVRLCQRGRSGFKLTDKGQLIYQASQRLFASLEEFRSGVGARDISPFRGGRPGQPRKPLDERPKRASTNCLAPEHATLRARVPPDDKEGS